MIVHFVCIRISVYFCVNTRYSAMLPGYQRCVYDVSTVGNNILPFFTPTFHPPFLYGSVVYRDCKPVECPQLLTWG